MQTRPVERSEVKRFIEMHLTACCCKVLLHQKCHRSPPIRTWDEIRLASIVVLLIRAWNLQYISQFNYAPDVLSWVDTSNDDPFFNF